MITNDAVIMGLLALFLAVYLSRKVAKIAHLKNSTRSFRVCCSVTSYLPYLTVLALLTLQTQSYTLLQADTCFQVHLSC